MEDHSLNLRIIVVLGFASISGFLIGYDRGVVSGAMLQVQPYFEMSNFLHEFVVSTTVGAGAIFSITGGLLGDFLGRKLLILTSSLFFLLGFLFLTAAISIPFLFIGRFLVGVGVGLSAMCVPIYIAEIVPFEYRGTLVSLHPFSVVVGLIVATVVDATASSNAQSGWRIMFGFGIIPAAIQLMGIFIFPESPRWLIQGKKMLEAQAVLSKIRSSPSNVKLEIELIQNKMTFAARRSCWIILRDMVTDPVIRRVLVVGCSLQLFQQLVGLNTVLSYGSTIIKIAGITSDTHAMWICAGVTTIYALGVGASSLMLDRIGRRILLLISNMTVFISLIFLTVAFLLIDKSSPATNDISPGNTSFLYFESCQDYSNCQTCISALNCGFCYDELTVFESSNNFSFCIPAEEIFGSYTALCQSISDESSGLSMVFASNYCPSKFSYLALLGILTYLLSFAIGFSAIPWTVNSEIYPQWCRSLGNSIGATINYSSNLLISITFLSLTDTITLTGVLFFYAVFALVSLIFFFFMLPETRKIPLEEVYLQFTPTFPGQPHWGFDNQFPSQFCGENQSSTSEKNSLDKKTSIDYGTLPESDKVS